MKNIKRIKKENKNYTRKFLLIADLKTELYTGDFGECFCDYDNGYICDVICEIADNNIDIYTKTLLEWACDNYGYIEEAIDNFGFPTNDRGQANFIEAIMQGQFYAYEQDLYEHLENNIKNLIFYYIEYTLKYDEITETQYNKLIEEIDFENNNEQIENIFETVNKIINNEMSPIDYIRTRKKV